MEGLVLGEYALFLMLGLLIKHYFADYTLQSSWIIKGKGSFARAGGYVHAAIHVVGTTVVLAVLSVPAALIWILGACEFVIHFLLDFAKVNLGDRFSSSQNPWKFWAINGLDQLFHHMTYVLMVWVIVQKI